MKIQKTDTHNNQSLTSVMRCWCRCNGISVLILATRTGEESPNKIGQISQCVSENGRPQKREAGTSGNVRQVGLSHSSFLINSQAVRGQSLRTPRWDGTSLCPPFDTEPVLLTLGCGHRACVPLRSVASLSRQTVVGNNLKTPDVAPLLILPPRKNCSDCSREFVSCIVVEPHN